MFNTKNSKHALRVAALGLAVAGAFALPHAGAQEAAPAVSQDNAVVVKDGVTGKLRAATVQENNALKENNGNAKKADDARGSPANAEKIQPQRRQGRAPDR